MNKFIWEKQNALTSEFCKNVIYKFERDIRKKDGITLGGVDKDTKVSTDLSISKMANWENVDKIFSNSLKQALNEYREYIGSFCPLNPLMLDLTDTGFQLQRTIGGEGFYNWHHDFTVSPIDGYRLATFIWYLNDVSGPGGETEFEDGTKITPEEGKLIFFPATWTFMHRGVTPPKGTVKYIATGWLFFNPFHI